MISSTRIFLRRGLAFMAVIALVALMAACSPSTDASGDGAEASEPATGGGTVAVTDGVVELTAADLAFDANVIQAPAGEAFTISFTNNDSAPHNVSVYTEEGGDVIVEGEVIDPGASTEVQVEALDAGEYFFVCDIHPDMNGSVVVEG
ncbi:MAG: cupredoxin domain-containing protein [Candidatus Limnocylindria bacterium]